MNYTTAIVLAAGMGTRMKSTTINKVALKLVDKPIIAHSIENVQAAGINNIIVVVGFAQQSVKDILGNSVTYANQANRLGTGHAVKIGLKKVPPQTKTVISIYGDDSAFYPPELIKNLINHHHKTHSKITVLTIRKDDPTGLGRIVRDHHENFVAIVEEKVATREQKAVKEINTGLYCFDRQFLTANIDKIKRNPTSREYYLTDIIEIAVKQKQKVEALLWNDELVWQGVNKPEELGQAVAKMQARHK